MHDAVQRRGPQRDLCADPRQELGPQAAAPPLGPEGVLQEEVQAFEPVASAQDAADLPESPRCQALARGQRLLDVGQVARDRPRGRLVARVAGEEFAVALVGFDVGEPVDGVGVVDDGGEAGRDESFGQSRGRLGEVGRHGEAAEALAEGAPRLVLESPAEVFGVGDDRILSEAGEVRGLRPGAADVGDGLGVERVRRTGAAFVEQDDPIVVERRGQPRADGGHPRRGEAGPTLEVDEAGPVFPAFAYVFAGEDFDPRRGGRGFLPSGALLRGSGRLGTRRPRRCRRGLRRRAAGRQAVERAEAVEGGLEPMFDHGVAGDPERRVVHESNVPGRTAEENSACATARTPFGNRLPYRRAEGLSLASHESYDTL